MVKWLNQNIFVNAAVAPVGKWSQKRTAVNWQQHHRCPRLADAVGEWRLIWMVRSMGELLSLRFWQKEYVHHNLLQRELHSYREAKVPMLTLQDTSGLWRVLCLKGQQPLNLKTWIVAISISLASASVQLEANQPHIHTKLVPSCKDTALNLQTRWLNYFLGWAACPHPGSHSKQMGGNWNRCLQMLQSGGMDSSHQANKWADWETVCLWSN